MRIEEALCTYLVANNDIATAVGTRVYSFHSPQKAVLPFITYRRISTERLLTHDQTEQGLASPRFQFDIRAKTFASGLDTVEALRKALQGYKGTMGGVGGVGVGAALPALEQHDDEPDSDNYRITVDYIISHQEE